MALQKENAADQYRPTTADLTGDGHYAQLARTHWLQASASGRKAKPEVVKDEIWDYLEKENFPYSSLLILESLQILENYLWPSYNDDSSNYLILLIALLINVKRREGLPCWDYFSSRPAEFSSLFRRVRSMTLDTTLSPKIRTHLLSFVIGAFQSLDNGLVRKECAPLVSIAVWHNLASDTSRNAVLEKHTHLKKVWRASIKRYDTADEGTKARLRFERSWLFTLILDFFNRLYDVSERMTEDSLIYCERFVELLSDLQSQLPTRRYVNTLLRDLNVLSAIKLSPQYGREGHELLRDLVILLRHFSYFPVDDQSGRQLSLSEYEELHFQNIARLQKLAFKHFKDKLTILALSNYSSVDRRSELRGLLEGLTDSEIAHFCALLGLRTQYPSSSSVVQDRAFLLEILLSAYERRPHFQESVKNLTTVPVEETLYEAALVRNETYNGTRPLAIPKLNLQYLTSGDFLWRSFILYRCESFYEIRKDLEDIVKRVQPLMTGANGTVRFEGFSRMVLPIPRPGILEVLPPKVGKSVPAEVRAEVILDVSRLNEAIRREWEALRTGDVVFLASVQVNEEGNLLSNGHSDVPSAKDAGLKLVRTAEVIQVLDDNSRPLRHAEANGINGHSRRIRQRRLLLKLDAATYQTDSDRTTRGLTDVYENINLIVRRRSRENNFKPILESIKHLTLSDIPIPSWLQDMFLGYGDPTSTINEKLTSGPRSIDFRDTFLDWQHLVDSFPGRSIEAAAGTIPGFGPPYVLQINTAAAQPATERQQRKRRHSEVEAHAPKADRIQVSTYKPPNTGPYPMDAPKLNAVRFTPAQVKAITSGTQPGLTVIVGPPGTGKTDVATQIINNIYHNFPEQRTLLIARSNQALNQLFQKITMLDIDERHLLRLGHGEEELETEANYSKHGRVESFLERGYYYLAEVDRLAANFNAPGAHGSSCETAGYFNSVYVIPAWTKYWDTIQALEITREEIIETFPFHDYFANAPQPLFPPDASRESLLDTVKGCYHHIEKIFSELEDIRPFEILRNGKDKANYLLIKEARIIAMTSTHAAMRRQEIANLGFVYHNVIMEEAAQITEIENFIPLALQNPKDGQVPLQRVVMCGDHLQNAPVVQNLAFLEQSLFLRLVRLGVPTIMLDQQGRARPSIAELYKWRYPKLDNLPIVLQSPEFRTANAGFRYEYQFVDVPDYKGRGEMEPTPHFVQNLGEAEYAVAIYMYMRLLGYPAEKISILTTYAGQRALIRDVLAHRCRGNPLFGLPRVVATVDRYQGEQNDYVILSLTRTLRPGYLRSIRRLTVALSRSRLGLYILGRREVFEACYELKQAFDIIFKRPDKLTLVTGEIFPARREVDEDVADGQVAVMEGVEHLGQYVYEMTQAKVEDLKRGGGVLPVASQQLAAGGLDDEEDEEVGEEAGYADADRPVEEEEHMDEIA